MVCQQTTKLASLIKECRAEMQNDLFYLQHALSDDNNLSILATKSTRVKRTRKPKKQILSSTLSDEFTATCGRVSKAHSSNGTAAHKVARTWHKRGESHHSCFTYKHYDLYLLCKRPIESRRNVERHSSFAPYENIQMAGNCERSNIVQQSSADSSLNETRSFFEPQLASSPVHREQKTSTPAKCSSSGDVSQPAKILLNCGSRLKFVSSSQTLCTTGAASQSSQNVRSTSEGGGRSNGDWAQSTMVLKEFTLKEISDCVCRSRSKASLLSQQNVSSVLRCCMNPLRQLIKGNKRSKKLRKTC